MYLSPFRRPLTLSHPALRAISRSLQPTSPSNSHLRHPRTMTTSNAYPVGSSRQIEATAQHLASGTNTSINNWATPGPASSDFRSDTLTTATASMLTAIASTTLLDDVFQEDPTTNSFQQFMAELTGKQASLLVMSGTMGNQVAIRAHLGAPPHQVLCDYRAHILEWEAGGVASLCGAMVKGVVPKNGAHLTLADVKRSATISDDIHACPTRLISLENTLGGTVLPLEECRRISEWAREMGILMHLDGARLWEAVAAGKGGLTEYCECFDSVQLCFSKGLGAPMGSIIVGTEAFIKRCRWIRKSIGGGIRAAGVISSAARTAVEETYQGGLLQKTHQNAKRIADTWVKLGGKLTMPVETNMVWPDLEAAGVNTDDFVVRAQRKGIRTYGSRIVVHYQISEEALSGLEDVMKDVLKKGPVSEKEKEEAEIKPEDMKINTE